MNATPSKYINRELSWLEFNQRVLDEARNPDVPLLERLRFLAITVSNLDEFFMVRVGGLRLLTQRGVARPDPAGMTPAEQMGVVGRRTRDMVTAEYECYLGELEPALSTAGVRRVHPPDMTERQRDGATKLFESDIRLILTPMAVTGADDFPLLVNLSLNACVRLAPAAAEPNVPRFAVIPLGQVVRRFVTLPSDGGYSFIMLEDVVAMLIDRFFPGEDVLECVPFRLTRNADMGLREDQAFDLLAEMEELLDARKESDCVRLEIADHASPELLSFLREALGLGEGDMFAVPGPLDLSAFRQLADLSGFDDLRYPPWPPQPSPSVDPTVPMFDELAHRDLLLYHPYESFEPVVRLIEEAARDPDVLAIKQILYRTSRDSPVVAALARAAENGKYVTAVVELKARFDEARNIEWARSLEQAGVQVIYGIKGFKTHAKVCIIVRREPQGIQRYLHLGTGNYNEQTARLYSDVSFMTANEELAADATNFFNAISGYSQPQRFRKIEAAPIGLRERLTEMIENETHRKQQGQKAQITAKLNSLVDPQIIDALYSASQAGVKVRLNVRGICCLRPGVPGLSENISVVSIVDRYLEHARILYFYHGGDERVFISSADWMPRNLDRRIELLVPVEDPASQKRLIAILESHLQDTVKARQLTAEGVYEPVKPRGRRKPFRSQEELYRRACEAVKQEEQFKRTAFETHRKAASGS